MTSTARAGHIAFGMAMVGITATTLGHYCESWALGYVVSILMALIAAMVYDD